VDTERGLESADYSDAHRYCDVVMKGGITSGVVYPQAVCELARDYRFKCVGGTSAGAIAAAATAAAEHGREGGGGFAQLAGLPKVLGDNGRLQRLFQPDPSTKSAFTVLMGALDGGLVGTVKAAVKAHWIAALLGAVPGLALVVLAVLHWIDTGLDALAGLGIVIGALAVEVGVVVAVVWQLAQVLLRKVPDNGFGICSGAGVDQRGDPALTPWLADLLDQCAGLVGEAGPLTFGHLWAGPDGDREAPPEEGKRFVELEMMTTNLVNRTGKSIPWERSGWYFDPIEFRRLFPEPVVKWMEDHPPDLPDTQKGRESEVHRAMMLPRRPFPAPADLPVVVAARMSLSFPVLLSAVPLWSFDFTRPATASREKEWKAWLGRQPGWPADWQAPPGRPETWGLGAMPAQPEPEVCWFSDGGISSNFPIHFFDHLVPGRPTFGINLRPFPLEKKPDPKDQSKNVAMAKDNNDGQKLWWYRLPGPAARLWKERRLGAFLGAAVKTMQNRVDEAQMRAPGFRDRIAHVELDKEEGGMNLNMDGKRIEKLSERGRDAAALLSAAFQADPGAQPITWDNHRWIRLRSAFAALEQMHVEFTEGFEGEGEDIETGWRTYQELLDRAETVPPTSYKLAGAAEKDRAGFEVGAIGDLGTGDEVELLVPGAPKPTPVGRIVPKE
jgi:hypothetical protein